MAKVQQNIWTYVIIALIIGLVIGYVVGSGSATGGKAIVRTATKAELGCPAGYNLVCSSTTGACSCVQIGATTDVTCTSPGSGSCAPGQTQQNCNTGTYCCDGQLGGNGVTCTKII